MIVVHPLTTPVPNSFSHSAQTPPPIAVTPASTPNQVAIRSGTVEKEVMPSMAKLNIFRRGYFVLPAKRAGRS